MIWALGFGRDLTTPAACPDCTKLQPILSYGGGHGSNAGAASRTPGGFMRTKVGPGMRRGGLGASLRSVESFYAENRVFRIFGGSSRIIAIRPFLLGMLGKGRGRSDVNKRHRDRLSLTPGPAVGPPITEFNLTVTRRSLTRRRWSNVRLGGLK